MLFCLVYGTVIRKIKIEREGIQVRKVLLTSILEHPAARKYIERSGLAHAVQVTEYAYQFARETGVSTDLATKAALLHDVGHYTWYRDGNWDYEAYRMNDIHAIKGASRAHKLLIELGEDRENAKQIAIAILLHTDSYLPTGNLELSPLQQVVKQADEADEEVGGKHHERWMSFAEAKRRIRKLDQKINQKSQKATSKLVTNL